MKEEGPLTNQHLPYQQRKLLNNHKYGMLFAHYSEINTHSLLLAHVFFTTFLHTSEYMTLLTRTSTHIPLQSIHPWQIHHIHSILLHHLLIPVILPQESVLYNVTVGWRHEGLLPHVQTLLHGVPQALTLLQLALKVTWKKAW